MIAVQQNASIYLLKLVFVQAVWQVDSVFHQVLNNYFDFLMILVLWHTFFLRESVLDLLLSVRWDFIEAKMTCLYRRA
jgi:hypothetical protein